MRAFFNCNPLVRFGLPVLVALVCVPSFAQSYTTPPTSTVITGIAEESQPSAQMLQSNSRQVGDLWPTCWSNDGNLYAANGDGVAFSGGTTVFDMAVSQITGTPNGSPGLAGTTVSSEVAPATSGVPSQQGAIGLNYLGNNNTYNDKPTGMLCVGGNLYLAYQNLATSAGNFTGAPAATVLRSQDHGHTWSTPPATPMFGSTNPQTPGLFTTVFFLDKGQDAGTPPAYIYAYGLDGNWTGEQNLYLARVPYDVNGTVTSDNLLNSSTWQFYSGLSGEQPTWMATVHTKTPVLTDTRSLYNTIFRSGTPNSYCPESQPVIAQGGVVYDAGINRYLYSSWSCSTHEFYEAPNPWGPWSHIGAGGTNGGMESASKDFGVLLLDQNRGQYATTIPSKFLSTDGKTVYLQSNVADPINNPNDANGYTFALRKVYLQLPVANAQASNGYSSTNLATMPNTLAISKSTHYGQLCGVGCTDILTSTPGFGSEDDYDDENKVNDGYQSFWGYTWPQPYNINQVAYTSGQAFSDGGWFGSNLKVQLLENGTWTDAQGSVVNPAYPYTSAANPYQTYTFTFTPAVATGVRIVGNVATNTGSVAPSYFTSISSLGVYYNNGTGNQVADPGFEQQTTSAVSHPWSIEGPDGHGIDLNAGFAHSGNNNAWIRDSTTNWNSVIQTIAVTPNTNYTLTGWVQNNFTSSTEGYFGVRAGTSTTTFLSNQAFGPASRYQQISATFNSGSNSTVTLFFGFNGTGADQYMRLDDVALAR
jgi:hypothetical protein